MAPNSSSRRRNSWSRLAKWGIPISVVALLLVCGLAATSRAAGLSATRGSAGESGRVPAGAGHSELWRAGAGRVAVAQGHLVPW